MAEKQPTLTPGYSGGAVPESHRSSLFTSRRQLSTASHQIPPHSTDLKLGLSTALRHGISPPSRRLPLENSSPPFLEASGLHGGPRKTTAIGLQRSHVGPRPLHRSRWERGGEPFSPCGFIRRVAAQLPR